MKTLFLSLVLLLQAKNESTSVWRNVGTYQRTRPGDNRPLSAAQVEAVREALKKDEQLAECRDEESADSVLQKLRFERIQLSSSSENVLVEAGPGCLRGGQESYGAMWIVQLGRGNATQAR
jgi:hypothetical protein